MFRRILIAAGMLTAMAVPTGVGVTAVAPHAAHAFTNYCSGSTGHGIFDASDNAYVVDDSSDRLSLYTLDIKQWTIYLDNQPTSPEYGMYAICSENTGMWVTWYNTGSDALKSNATSPWTNPSYSFFTDPYCGSAPDGKWLMDFSSQASFTGWANSGGNYYLYASATNEDWFTADGLCGVP